MVLQIMDTSLWLKAMGCYQVQYSFCLCCQLFKLVFLPNISLLCFLNLVISFWSNWFPNFINFFLCVALSLIEWYVLIENQINNFIQFGDATASFSLCTYFSTVQLMIDKVIANAGWCRSSGISGNSLYATWQSPIIINELRSLFKSLQINYTEANWKKL